MTDNIKNFYYDKDLNIEVYSFDNLTSHFPSHFHDYYVIGIAEKGERILHLNDKEYTLSKGDIFFFNPKDTHSCTNKKPFSWKILKIQKIEINKIQKKNKN